MKKLTSNTFTEGLLKDFHPLTVPNNVMTDALNATIITMNGNERILQNDMGNSRVESAFLPAGYVPVGIKEYGGIIYVASYNPITNKGQIGSFPSPERNIDLTEIDYPENSLGLLNKTYTRTYKYSGFNNNPKYTVGIGGLMEKVDIFGEKNYIRAGDKFGFYFDASNKEEDNNLELLSNYFLFDKTLNDPHTPEYSDSGPTYIRLWNSANKVYKNNLVTLSVQVLDANNNLRDITDLLKRYGSENEIIDTNDIKSKDDIFNTGYFIGNLNITELFVDPVNAERNKSALNTYNNKLYGKLFLVGKVNTPDHIDVSYRFIRESSLDGESGYRFVYKDVSESPAADVPIEIDGYLLIVYGEDNLDHDPNVTNPDKVYYKPKSSTTKIGLAFVSSDLDSGFVKTLDANDYTWNDFVNNSSYSIKGLSGNFKIYYSNYSEPKNSSQYYVLPYDNDTGIRYSYIGILMISLMATNTTKIVWGKWASRENEILHRNTQQNAPRRIIEGESLVEGENDQILIDPMTERNEPMDHNYSWEAIDMENTTSEDTSSEDTTSEDTSLNPIDVVIGENTPKESLEDERVILPGLPSIDEETTNEETETNEIKTESYLSPLTYSAIKFTVEEYFNCPNKYITFPQIVLSTEGQLNDVYKIYKLEKSENFYDNITNLYKTTINYYIQPLNENIIIHYLFIPLYKNVFSYVDDLILDKCSNENGDIRFTNLAVEGSIDLSKIGTKSKITRWKYRYVDNLMNLVWGLEDYLYEDDVIMDMKMEFYDLSLQNPFGEPAYVRVLYNKTGSSIGEWISLNEEDNELLPRHIYFVRLSRIKNEIYEEIGDRIIITTPIYNELFNLYEDYYSEEAKNAINEKNKIKVNLNLGDSDFLSTGLNVADVDEKVYKKINGVWTPTASSFKNISNVEDLDLYELINYYNVTNTNTVGVSLNISDIYPFEINNNNISYKLNLKLNEEDNLLERIQGSDDLNELIEDNLFNDKITVDGVLYTKNGEWYSYNNKRYTGAQDIKITNQYYFPSKLIYAYDQDPSSFTYSKSYKKFIDYVKEKISEINIVFPIIANRPRGNAMNSLHDILYFDLLYINGNNNISSFGANKDENMEYELFEIKSDNTIRRDLSNAQSKIDKCLNELDIRNFCIVGSPPIFGINSHDRITSILGYDSGGKCNYKLVPYKNLESNVNNSSNGTSNWAYLLWKDINGNFIIVNNALMSGTTTKAQLINKIFSGVENLYFKTDKTVNVTNLYLIDFINATYNDTYQVTVYNTVKLNDVLFNPTNLLRYYNSNKYINFEDDETEIILQNSWLNEYLKFTVENIDNVVNTRNCIYTIPGMNSIVVQSNLTNGYVLESNENYYVRDKYNQELLDDFYILSNNNEIIPIRDLSIDIINFINKLSIKSNDVLISTTSNSPTRSNYGYTTYNGDDGKFIVYLGNYKYIDIPNSNYTTKLF